MTDRRQFLRVILAGLSLTVLGCFAYPLVRFLSPSAGLGPGGTVSIDKNDVPVGSAKDLVLNDLPIIVINRPQKGYIALSRVCTHLGCLVEYQKSADTLLCPCHAGKFDLEGNVISGPPPQPLPRLALKVEGNSLLIG
jgi:cytochrome b6-f complex iron-sulfur subunit